MTIMPSKLYGAAAFACGLALYQDFALAQVLQPAQSPPQIETPSFVQFYDFNRDDDFFERRRSGDRGDRRRRGRDYDDDDDDGRFSRRRRFGDDDRRGSSICITARGNCRAGFSAPRNTPCRCFIPGFGEKRGAIGG